MSAWIEAATGWLALGLYRGALRRMLDGRLPDDTGGGAAARLVEVSEAWRVRAAETRALRDADTAAHRLATAFALAPLELDLLALAVAADRATALLPALATLRPAGVEAALHVGLLAELVSAERDDEPLALDTLAGEATLARWVLVRLGAVEVPSVARAVGVPARVAAAAHGAPAQLDVALRTVARELPRKPDPRLPALRALAAAALGDGDEAVVFGGPPGAAHGRLLAAAAAEHGRTVIELALHLVDEATLDTTVRIAARDVRSRGGVLAFALDAATDEQRGRLERCSRTLATLAAMPLIVLGGERDAVRATGRDVVWIEAGPPAPADRALLLVGALAGTARAVDDTAVAAVAAAYPLSPDGLDAAAREAQRAARARGAALDSGDLLAGCRAQLDHRMGSIAEPVRSRVRADDLVVSAELADRLADLVDYVRHAATVYDRWGFGSHVAARGVSALFSGPPGTGKTMAASALASELGLELFRVDLSRIVSKYIGETEGNLARVFAEATHSRAILLFDEADSLFGKRTDVKSSVDRYANMEVNYLLQRMESFDGITILTTNHEAAIDEAFRRRLQFRLRFDPPDEALREQLWRVVIPSAAEVGRIDHRALAHRFEFAGAYIRNAAVRAAFSAAAQGRRITMGDLLDAAERELEEMGRLAQRRLA